MARKKEVPPALAALRELIEETKKKVQSEVGLFLKNELAAVFEAHPTLEEFYWRQYTDYFNDGEQCNFHAHTDNVYILVDGEEYETYDMDSTAKDIKEKNIPKMLKQISDVLELLENDELESVFGDHVEVHIKRNGTIELEEYTEHD